MAKKLSLLLAAAAVLAFAVPAFASAATGLTESGALVSTGTIIKGTNIGAVKTTSTKLGTIECQSVVVEAKLVTNSSAEVKATTGGTQSASTCTRAGASVEVKNIELNELKTTGGGKGTASAAFDVKLSESLTCHFVGTGDEGTYSTTETAEGGKKIKISAGPLTVTPIACGTTATLDGEFELTTTNGTPVFLM